MSDNSIWFYSYEIQAWTDYSECQSLELFTGIVPAHSLSNAITVLLDYYGEKNIEKISVEEYACNLLEDKNNQIKLKTMVAEQGW